MAAIFGAGGLGAALRGLGGQALSSMFSGGKGGNNQGGSPNLPTATDAKNAEAVADNIERAQGVLSRMGNATAFDKLDFITKNPITLAKNMYKMSNAMATSLDTLNAEVSVATGRADHYRGALEAVASESYKVGTSLDDVSKILVEYHDTFSLFPGMASKTQKEFLKLGATLDRLGVSTTEAGKAMDTLMRGLNMGLPEVKEFWNTMNMLSQEVGMGMEKLTADYTAGLPMLMKYGSSHVRVYQEMTYAQRKFGLSQQEIMQVTDQFDTFEGAAATVGVLNAHLANYGVQLNDIAMGQMNEAERLEYLNTELRRAGVSFQELSRRERQFFAQRLTGGDTDLLSRVMGDPQELANFSEDMKSMDERAQAFTSSIEKITAAFQKLIIDSGLMQAFEQFLKDLSEYDFTTLTGLASAAARIFAAPVELTYKMQDYAKAPTEGAERARKMQRARQGKASNIDSWRYTGDYFTDETGDLLRFNTGDLHYLPGGATGGTRLNSPAFTTGKDRDAFIRAIKQGMKEAMRESAAMSSRSRPSTKSVILRLDSGQQFKAYIEETAVAGVKNAYSLTSP